ncbi:hypothetical protein EXIGLDRAFT_777929 [Exidia glandulosa HHB12029]|uniref:Uncharacterized protein n=1 Tax=Exidia glandulosa HHB12029 TaxID=1314781 RepID=A0A165CTA3_EXIGL|nr:hypothetical protein EXIGLDRAFT_777929 [Exidia glandulosa HHB12029]
MSQEARSIIIGLLNRDPARRLGNNGGEEIKRHPSVSGEEDLQVAFLGPHGKESTYTSNPPLTLRETPIVLVQPCEPQDGRGALLQHVSAATRVFFWTRRPSVRELNGFCQLRNKAHLNETYLARIRDIEPSQIPAVDDVSDLRGAYLIVIKNWSFGRADAGTA